MSADQIDPEQIQRWVLSHAETLPTSLGALAAFPMDFRKAIAAAANPSTRLHFWSDHLEFFLTSPSDLDTVQQNLIRMVLVELQRLGDLDRAKGDEVFRDLVTRASSSLSPELVHRVFGMLGPPEPPQGLPLPSDWILRRAELGRRAQTPWMKSRAMRRRAVARARLYKWVERKPSPAFNDQTLMGTPNPRSEPSRARLK